MLMQLLSWMAARPWLAAPACVLFVAVVLGRDQLAGWRHQRLAAGARWVTIAAPPEVTATSAAAFWTTMVGVLTPATWRRIVYGYAHVAWEYTWTGRTLAIRAWVPGTIPPGAVEAAVSGAWPSATVETSEAGEPIPAVVVDSVGGAHWPAQADTLPLRGVHDEDPLRPLLAAGAQVRDREHVCVQILARPAPARRLRHLRRHASTGHAPPDLASRLVGGLATAAANTMAAVVEALAPGPSRSRTTAANRAVARDPVRDAQARTMVDKAVTVPHYEIAIRYGVGIDPETKPNAKPGNKADGRSDAKTVKDTDGKAAGKARARQRHERLAGLAHTIASAAAVYTGPNRLRRMKLTAPVAVLAGRRLRRGFVATVGELAALAALPQDLAVPGLDRARAKAMPAPVTVPAGGRGMKVLGRAQIGGRSVALPVVDSRQHMHVIGKTGVGKSTLLLNMIVADVKAGRGTVVIDPRGDLVTDVLERLPADYAKRIVIIDPDQENPGCFNPLEDTPDPHLAVDNLVGIFSKIFQRHWGPRIDDTLRVACLTLMKAKQPSLSLVPSLLSDREFRARFTNDLDDPDGLGGYWSWYDSINENLRGQVIGPVLARLRQFLLRDFAKAVIGPPNSSFQMADVLNGGLLLCRLPKGVIGEETARILGSLIVARTWQAAIARAATPENERKDATIYIDECQNFLNLPGSVDDMLAEARGFRLGLVLAHQNLSQLPPETASAISANARTKIMFNVDPNDARELSRHTKPEIDEHDLGHLDVFHASARLLVGNRELPAFTFTTNPPAEIVGEATAIRQAVAAAHARTSRESPMQQIARKALQRRRNKAER